MTFAVEEEVKEGEVCALRRWRFSFSDEELGPVLEELRQDPVQPAHLDLEVRRLRYY